MSDTEQLEKIEVSIEQAQFNIARKAKLMNLMKNPDFNSLVLEDYFLKEASRLVLVRADPNMQDEEHQKAIDQAIVSIGGFRQYINTIMQLGSMAERALKDDQETREEILAETA